MDVQMRTRTATNADYAYTPELMKQSTAIEDSARDDNMLPKALKKERHNQVGEEYWIVLHMLYCLHQQDRRRALDIARCAAQSTEQWEIRLRHTAMLPLSLAHPTMILHSASIYTLVYSHARTRTNAVTSINLHRCMNARIQTHVTHTFSVWLMTNSPFFGLF